MLSTQSEAAGASPTRAWPADQVERWPIERLLPYANNARLHSEADLDKIAASISNWGWTMPVLAAEDGVLIAGHLRVAAAAKLKLTSIPVVVARGWSEEEKTAYRLADNELAARASWDPDLLLTNSASSSLPVSISTWSASSRIGSKTYWPVWVRAV